MVNAKLKHAIAGVHRKYMEALARSDAEGMGKLYTSSGQILPANADFISGTEAIESFWQAVMDLGVKTSEIETVELEGCGDAAVEVGRYTLGDEDGEVLERGKYIVVWKKEAGQWKLHRDIWNSSIPALLKIFNSQRH